MGGMAPRVMVGLAALGCVGIVAVIVTTLTADDADRPDPGRILREANPLGVPWWQGGRLHLDDVVVPVAGVEGLVVVPDGVVVSDDRGRVTHVAADGQAEELGGGASAGQIESDPESGWVAWVDNHLEDRSLAPELIVWDTTTGREVARRDLTRHGPRYGELDEGDHPLAVDDGTVWYADQDGDYEWQVRVRDPQPMSEVSEIVDVSGETRLVRLRQGGEILVFTVGWIDPVPLESGSRLSDDGRWVLGCGLGESPARLFRDARAMSTGLPSGARVVGCAFGPGEATYVVGSPRDQDAESPIAVPWAPPFRLVRCTLTTPTCATVVDDLVDLPVLPT